jgi:hypothetical protein
MIHCPAEYELFAFSGHRICNRALHREYYEFVQYAADTDVGALCSSQFLLMVFRYLSSSLACSSGDRALYGHFVWSGNSFGNYLQRAKCVHIYER